jgi:hypothetical protein
MKMIETRRREGETIQKYGNRLPGEKNSKANKHELRKTKLKNKQRIASQKQIDTLTLLVFRALAADYTSATCERVEGKEKRKKERMTNSKKMRE